MCSNLLAYRIIDDTLALFDDTLALCPCCGVLFK